MTSTDLCTGCGACFAACPKQCITMRENKIGEIVPVIDEKECINCGVCTRVCPIGKKATFNYPSECFVAWSKDDKDIKLSASGGISAAFIRNVLSEQGIAYGCDYDSHCDLKHFKIEDENGIYRARGSKYSQSKAYGVFSEIKTSLKQNTQVLFVGTPCQVAGLKNFLKNDCSNLITVDLVCHGTPPNAYFKKHIENLGIKNPISRITFRGENDQTLTVFANDKIEYQNHYEEDSYFNAFYSNMISRNSCYMCEYAGAQRVSDITIGDFWGLKELKTIEPSSNRPSLVLINTPKGKVFFEKAKDNLFYEKRDVREGIDGNGRLIKPPGKNLKAKIFQRIYRIFDFELSVKIANRLNLIITKIFYKR